MGHDVKTKHGWSEEGYQVRIEEQDQLLTLSLNKHLLGLHKHVLGASHLKLPSSHGLTGDAGTSQVLQNAKEKQNRSSDGTGLNGLGRFTKKVTFEIVLKASPSDCGF